ncbi:hypothetical protein FAUST_6581 [Fusarium austroamericanum]|uniref:AB hydrolase-1 domain-containing protein n=1 Tax=Fusarium austroamericanum TaxID=282268 RepID=A0AAN6BZ34_FUSAU|nr:hypothetical protein FAUST_6581 [Fusarium austroamericanum]
MLFDYFGRGYSDAPTNVHDVNLYLTQILLVLSSSEIPWTGNKSFSIVGYSFGGALSMALAEYFPNLIDSITLVAPSGLVRDYHVGWQARLIYQGGWLPGDIRRSLVKRRLYIPPPPASPFDQNGTFRVGSSDATSGPDYDYAAISKKTPAVTVSDVLNWQITNHPGFVDAFISCINYAPIFNQNDSWTSVGNTLRERRQADTTDTGTNKVLLILGTSDPSIVTEEIIADATASLGEDGVNLIVLDGGHEIAITQGVKIADILSSHLVASTDQ